MYPNPVKEILSIKTESSIEKVNVMNATGQKMKVEFSYNRVNMSGLNAGLYWVEITLKNGEIISKKIIKTNPLPGWNQYIGRFFVHVKI